MPPVELLIVEDDRIWLNQHNEWFQQAGFCCHATDDSAIALQFAQNPLIRVGVIDEILFVPPVIPGAKGELQRWQGQGVIREIRKTGSDIRFIFITSAPSQRSAENQTSIFEEGALLRCLPPVIAVIHKEEMSNP